MWEALVPQRAPKELILQRLVCWWMCWTVMGVIWSWMGLALLTTFYFSPMLLAVIVCYMVYVRGPGWRAAETMSWPPLLRKLPMWRYMADYFSTRLVKTCELDPQGTYIFAQVPHGITSLSAWLHFCTDATGFKQTFPGIERRALTLDVNFRMPLIREYCLLSGLRSASRRSMRNILNSGPGSAVLIVPGGAAESLISRPGHYDTLIGARRGFVRLALDTGASLVPVVAFGENEAFKTWSPEAGSFGWRVLRSAKRVLGLATPIFWGTGVTGGWGILPLQTHLVTVVGRPIPVPRLSPASTSTPPSHAPAAALTASPGGSATGVPITPIGSSHSSDASSTVTEATAGSAHSNNSSSSSSTDTTASKAAEEARIEALVDHYHALFCAELQKLFDEHKEAFAPNRTTDLVFLTPEPAAAHTERKAHSSAKGATAAVSPAGKAVSCAASASAAGTSSAAGPLSVGLSQEQQQQHGEQPQQPQSRMGRLLRQQLLSTVS